VCVCVYKKGLHFKRFISICIDIFAVCSWVGAVAVFVILLAVKMLSVSQVQKFLIFPDL
jgi:hypothetical protein